MSIKELEQIKGRLEEGYFPQWVVSDPEIYKLEQEKIFGKTWQFLAHESELKESGSYITRMMAK